MLLCHHANKYLQTENVAKDLETFSRHAGRSTITTDDVLLLSRRNEDLQDIMQTFIDGKKAEKSAKGTGKGRK